MARLGLIALLVLGGCNNANQQTAAVRAWDGSSSELSITACPAGGTVKDTEAALHHILTELANDGVLVSGISGGSAKVSIDLCGK